MLAAEGVCLFCDRRRAYEAKRRQNRKSKSFDRKAYQPEYMRRKRAEDAAKKQEE